MKRPSPRVAITAVFFLNGALFSSWASRIPALADRTGASVGALGLALLAPAAGALLAMTRVGRLLPEHSSRQVCQAALIALAAAIVLPGLTTSVPALAAALLLVGAANGSLDVAMNAQGVAVERKLGRPILSSLHAAFSFGGFAGAGLGALAASAAIAPEPHLAFAAILFGLPGLLVISSLLSHDADPDAHAGRLRLRRLPGRLGLLGLAAFSCLFAEGAASDWSAKLVSGPLAGTAALGAASYAIFSVAMGVGRLKSDALWSRWGPVGLLRRAGALAGVGFAVALGIGTAPAALGGFAALGLGLSGVVPTLFRSAADEPGVATGPALAAVSSLGYLGFLTGPPLIGAVAQLTSLRAACGLLALGAGLVVLVAPASRHVRPRVAGAQACSGR